MRKLDKVERVRAMINILNYFGDDEISRETEYL